MSKRRAALGLDYGTSSVRALVVNVDTGEELATAQRTYPTGDSGVISGIDPHLARQNPIDYQSGFFGVGREVTDALGGDVEIVGIGVDTTGSTPIPVDAQLMPLAARPEFAANPDAQAWLWKDHTSTAEAEEITQLAHQMGLPYLEKCGGTYSSEWFWSKILHCARVAPNVFAAADSWIEAQDFVPAWLAGITETRLAKRGICAAGHKAMFHRDWGGLPSREFLAQLDPRLGDLRERLFSRTSEAGDPAGVLDRQIATESGLPAGIPISVGAFDAHLGAVGAGVRPGTMVKIMGTSTCDIMVGAQDTPDIHGVCGIVPGSVLPGLIGIEAGQSAVGDLFDWGARLLGQSHEELNRQAAEVKPGASGLLALDWNNGNRTILVDQLLTGLILGQSLHTTSGEIYRALIEATAFGARKIIDQIEASGVKIDEIIVCGGISVKSPLTMQIYADILNRPIRTSKSSQTCALGAAIAGAVAAGAIPDFTTGIEQMTALNESAFRPDSAASEVYDQLYTLYLALHDAFGRTNQNPPLDNVMKQLLSIQKQVRN